MRSFIFLSALLLVVSVGCKPTTETRADEIAAAKAAAEKPVETEMVKAEAGVGKEGQKLKGKEGILITPVKTLFNTKQRIEFEFRLEPALRLYEGANGHRPKTHEEFMEKIIKFNNIKLPELPAGQEYVYDPAKGELMVKRPK